MLRFAGTGGGRAAWGEWKRKCGYGAPADAYEPGVWALMPAKVMAWNGPCRA